MREPGGRLPTTWPARESDVPVLDVTPVNGTMRYDEGAKVGYRAWLRSSTAPAHPFGYGLGYTTWAVDRATAPTEFGPGGVVEVHAEVTNTGGRAGNTSCRSTRRARTRPSTARRGGWSATR